MCFVSNEKSYKYGGVFAKYPMTGADQTTDGANESNQTESGEIHLVLVWLVSTDADSRVEPCCGLAQHLSSHKDRNKLLGVTAGSRSLANRSTHPRGIMCRYCIWPDCTTAVGCAVSRHCRIIFRTSDKFSTFLDTEE